MEHLPKRLLHFLMRWVAHGSLEGTHGDRAALPKPLVRRAPAKLKSLVLLAHL